MSKPKLEDQQKAAKLHGSAIKSKDKSSVLTWDVEQGKFASIWLESW